jgi:glutaredoxin
MKQVKIYTRNACQACEATKREAAKAVADGLVFDLDVVNVQDEGLEPVQDFLAYQDSDSPGGVGWRAMPVVKVYSEDGELLEAWGGHKVGKLTTLIAA